MDTKYGWFLNSSAQLRGHGSLNEESCTANLFGTTMVMAVCAPDSKKSLEMCEECISSVVEVLREGRKGGARGFLNQRRPHSM